MAKYPEGTVKNGYVVAGGKWVPMPKESVVPAPIAEYAGGVNRGVAKTADFFTTAPANTIADLLGSDFRIPSFEQGLESVTGGTHGFMKPGLARDVVATAGEWTPSLTGVIGKAPEIAVNTGNTAQLMDDAAPSIAQLKSRASSLYDKVDEMDAAIPQEYLDDFVKTLTKTLDDSGLRTDSKASRDITPKAYGAYRTIRGDIPGPEAADDMIPEWLLPYVEKTTQRKMTVRDIENFRKTAAAAVTDPNPAEARFGGIIQSTIDDFLENLPEEAIGAKASETLKQARLLTQQRKKAETIEKAMELAKTYASGYENGLKLQFQGLHRQIIRGQLKGFNKDEIDAIKKVADGGPIENLARAVGKLGVSEGSALRTLVPGLGASAGFYLGNMVAGPLGGAAGATGTLAVGQGFRNLASKLTQQNAQLAGAITRAGPNARLIISEYMKAVPAANRSPEELASLFFSAKVPIRQLAKIGETKAFAPYVISAANMAANAADTVEGE